MSKIKMRNSYGIEVPVEVPDEEAELIQEGHKHYVLMRGMDGRDIPVEVTAEVYQLFVEEYRFWVRRSNQQRDHLDKHSLEDYSVISQAVAESMEDTYQRRVRISSIYDVLQSCTPVQRERFYLNRVCGYKCTEIAKMQESGARRVRKSIDAVLKKIKKIMN